MTNKDALAIFGLIMTKEHYYEDDDNTLGMNCLVIEYLESLNIPYKTVKKIIENDTTEFYHTELGYGSIKLPKKYKKNDLVRSDYDYITISEDGAVGIWCEIDGFVAWLDEYKKCWIN